MYSVKHALKTLKMIARSGFLTALECTKFVFGLGPAGGAHDAPPDPLAGWGGDSKALVFLILYALYSLLIYYVL